jgi:hypothetical protein
MTGRPQRAGADDRDDNDGTAGWNGKGLTLPVALDPRSEVARTFGLMGLPGTFIVRADAYVKAGGYGPREWDSRDARTLITSLLTTPTPPRPR